MSDGSINLADILESHADTFGDRIAVITDDCVYTYGYIDNEATRLANFLKSCGFGYGDHIAIHSRNRIEWIYAFYACLKIRAVPININYRYSKNELLYLYNNANVVATLVSDEFYDDVYSIYSNLPKLKWVGKFESIYENSVRSFGCQRNFEKRSGDDIYITYTGGTTGMPKGVVWRQEDLILAAMNKGRNNAPIDSVKELSLECLNKQFIPKIMCTTPMMHASGQWVMGSALVLGATYIMYTNKTFTGYHCLSLAEKSEANSMSIIGDGMAITLIDELSKNTYNLKNLFSINNGGAFLSEINKKKLIELLPHISVMDVYGGSEIGGVVAKVNDSSFVSPEDTIIVDDNYNKVDCNIIGKIAKTGHLPIGYYSDSLKTNMVFKEIDDKRWCIPGDLGYITESGELVLLGRDNNCINTGGEKVYPEEVEEVIKSYPGVTDAVVIGKHHDRWGQQVTCVINCDTEIDFASLKKFCLNYLADYKIPKEFIKSNLIPRNEIGKIDYKKIKELYDLRPI